jgi:hypothetical protein
MDDFDDRRILVPTGGLGPVAPSRRGTGGTRRGDFGRQAEMPQDPIDYLPLLDERDQAEAAAAPGAGQNVEPEGTVFILHLPQWN